MLDSLPPGTPPEARERALSEFYKGWVQQEARHQESYTREWRRRNFEEVRLAARARYQKLKARLGLADTSIPPAM